MASTYIEILGSGGGDGPATDVNVVNTPTVTGPLTNSQLRASAVPVDGSGVTQPVSGTFWQATQPVSAASLPLPTGAATESTLQAIDAGIPAALGQTTMAASMPVVLASNHSDINVQITDGAGVANTRQLSSAIVAADIGLITHSVIHGVTTGGGGGYVDVKVNPSGALTVESTVTSSALPAGAATAALQTQPGVDIGDVTINNGTGASAVNIQDGGNSITVDGTVAATQSGTWNITNVSGTVSLPTGAATETTLAAMSAKLPAALGQTTMANSLAVTLASNQTSIPVAATLSAETTKVIGTVNISSGQTISLAGVATSSVTSVASSASNVTLLASNASRKMATVFNESSKVLYIKLGATASATSYTVQVSPGSFFELPQPAYTGQIDGIWAAANGNARITEY